MLAGTAEQIRERRALRTQVSGQRDGRKQRCLDRLQPRIRADQDIFRLAQSGRRSRSAAGKPVGTSGGAGKKFCVRAASRTIGAGFSPSSICSRFSACAIWLFNSGSDGARRREARLCAIDVEPRHHAALELRAREIEKLLARRHRALGYEQLLIERAQVEPSWKPRWRRPRPASRRAQIRTPEDRRAPPR